MCPEAISRRRFLALSARVAAGMGAATIMLDPPGLDRLFAAALSRPPSARFQRAERAALPVVAIAAPLTPAIRFC